MALNNNQIFTLVNEAYKQALGENAIAVENLEGFTDTGVAYESLQDYKEQFTDALLNLCVKNWFSDTSYRSQYDDPFFEDSREMGAIVQFISATMPEVKESPAWDKFVSGTSQVGVYTVYLPIVETKVYSRSVSWSIPIFWTGEQWDDAFKSSESLGEFISYIMMMMDNKIVCHLEEMNEANRNNFIAEKFVAEADPNVNGVHCINLIAAYNKERNGSIATVEEFLKDAAALRYAAATIDEYTTYVGKMSALFNTAGKPRFTPDERKIVQVVKKFAKAISEVSLSGAFNARYVELPAYKEVPYWQGFGSKTSWDDVTSICVETGNDGTSVNKTGIVACIVDKWAIMHTIRKRRVATNYFSVEDLYQNEWQFRDQYMNDLTMNGVIFYLEDISDNTIAPASVAAGSGSVFGVAATSLQSGITVSGDKITGTLKYHAPSTPDSITSVWGNGNFIYLAFTPSADAATTFVGLTHSAGSGLQALDSDNDALLKITSATAQKLIVRTITSSGAVRTQYYDLSGLTIQTA